MQATTNAKTFRSHFLFQTHCDGSRRRWFLLWNWGFLIAAAIGTGLLSLLLAVGRYPGTSSWATSAIPSSPF